MKKILLLSFLLFFLFLAKSSTAYYAINLTLNWTYNASWYGDFASDLIYYNDSYNIISVNGNYLVPTVHNGNISRIAKGSLMNRCQGQFLNNYSTPFYSVAHDSSNNIYIVGNEYYLPISENCRINLVIYKDDLNCNLAWKKTYSSSFKVPIDAIVDGNNNLIVATFTWWYSWCGGTTPNYTITIFKFDSNGNLLWNRDFVNASWYDYTTNAKIKTDSQDNIILIVNYPSRNSYLLKISKDGDMIWNKTEVNRQSAIAVDSNDNVIEINAVAINKFDKNGNLIYSTATGASISPIDVEILPNGDSIGYGNLGGNYFFMYYDTSTNGSFRWYHFLGSGTPSYGHFHVGIYSQEKQAGIFLDDSYTSAWEWRFPIEIPPTPTPSCRICDPVSISRSGSAYYLLSGWCLLLNLTMCNPILLSGLFIIGLLAFIFIKLKFSK